MRIPNTSITRAGRLPTNLRAPAGLMASNPAAALHGIGRSAVGAGLVPGSPADRQQKRIKQRQEEETPGLAIRSMETANHAFLPFFIMDGLGFVGGAIGGGMGMLGYNGKFRTPFDAVQKPRIWMEDTPFSVLGSSVSGKLAGFSSRKLGENSAVTSGLNSATGAIQSAEEGVGKALGGVASGVGYVASIGDPLYQKIARRREAQIPSRQKAFHRDLGALEEAISEHQYNLGTAEGAAEHVDALRQHMIDLREFSQGKPTLEGLEKISEAQHGMTKSLGELHEAHGSKITKEASEALSKVGKAVEGMGESTTKFEKAAAGSIFWSDIKSGLARLPKQIGKMNSHGVLLNTGMLLPVGIQGAHSVHNFRNAINHLEEMCAEMEGKKSVSLAHILAGNPPPQIKRAAKQICQQYAPELISEFGVGAFTIMLMSGGANMFKMGAAIFGQTALPQLAQAAAPEYNMVELYTQMKDMKALGEPIPHSAYASFLIASSPEVAKTGMHNKLMHAVASEYEKMQATPGQILTEMKDGKFLERSKAAQDELKAQGNEPGDKITGEAEAKLNGIEPSSAAEEKAVLGKHTARVVDGDKAKAVTNNPPVVAANSNEAPEGEVPANVIHANTAAQEKALTHQQPVRS